MPPQGARGDAGSVDDTRAPSHRPCTTHTGVFAVQAIGICFGLVLHHLDTLRPSKRANILSMDARDARSVVEAGAAAGSGEERNGESRAQGVDTKPAAERRGEAPIRASVAQIAELRRMLDVLEAQSVGAEGGSWAPPTAQKVVGMALNDTAAAARLDDWKVRDRAQANSPGPAAAGRDPRLVIERTSGPEFEQNPRRRSDAKKPRSPPLSRCSSCSCRHHRSSSSSSTPPGRAFIMIVLPVLPSTWMRRPLLPRLTRGEQARRRSPRCRGAPRLQRGTPRRGSRPRRRARPDCSRPTALSRLRACLDARAAPPCRSPRSRWRTAQEGFRSLHCGCPGRR